MADLTFGARLARPYQAHPFARDLPGGEHRLETEASVVTRRCSAWTPILLAIDLHGTAIVPRNGRARGGGKRGGPRQSVLAVSWSVMGDRVKIS